MTIVRRFSNSAATVLPAVLLLFAGCQKPGEQASAPPQPTEGYHFCFWNVENLFDDKNDDYGRVDEKYDHEYSSNPKTRQTKLDRLSEVLLSMNGGKGPDVLAVAEVEGPRAAEMLRDHLNQKLGNRAAPYNYLACKEVRVGRHVTPAVISRVPIEGTRTHLLDKRKRILEVHLKADEHKLVVVASHWTSRVSDKTGEKRAQYADLIYGRFLAMHRANPEIDFLVCGDFNDNPADTSVAHHLHVRHSQKDGVVSVAGSPQMINPFASLHKSRSAGTLYYGGKWNLFDQIVVSPGLVDAKGWSMVTGSARIENAKAMRNRAGKPRSFHVKTKNGGHGYADHFPVSVRLRVHK